MAQTNQNSIICENARISSTCAGTSSTCENSSLGDGRGASGTSASPDRANASMVERSFPTAAKEKEKQREAVDKSRGVARVVKKKPKVIERHFDDCRDNLRGLGESFSFTHCEGFSSSSDEDDGIPLIQWGRRRLSSNLLVPAILLSCR